MTAFSARSILVNFAPIKKNEWSFIPIGFLTKLQFFGQIEPYHKIFHRNDFFLIWITCLAQKHVFVC